MTNQRIGLLWFAAAVLFFLAAMLRDDNRAVYIALGALFIILGAGLSKKKGEK